MATGVSGTTERDLRAALYADKMHNLSFYETFNGPINMNVCTATGGDPTGAAGDVNFMHTARNSFQTHILGTQTILGPTPVTTGLDIIQDLTDDDGVEYTPAMIEFPEGTVAGADGMKAVYTVGTDGPIYTSLRFTLADVSDTDDCAFGFRKLEAFQANLDDYDEMAAFNIISGVVNLETIINGATTVTTDTTEDDWADAGTHTLTVFVALDGKVTFEYDGAAPTVTKAFTFDSGEVIVPFFYYLNSATAAAKNCVLVRWEGGPTGFGDGFEVAPARTGGV